LMGVPDVQAQQSAIKAATRLGWTTALLEKRLASYTAGQPWFGDLLAF
jgi:hypothetical protein